MIKWSIIYYYPQTHPVIFKKVSRNYWIKSLALIEVDLETSQLPEPTEGLGMKPQKVYKIRYCQEK